MIIALKNFRIPEDDADSFSILKENGIINNEMYKSLKEAKGMRNFIVHQYGQINNGLVYEAITKELKEDIIKFLEAAEKLK